ERAHARGRRGLADPHLELVAREVVRHQRRVVVHAGRVVDDAGVRAGAVRRLLLQEVAADVEKAFLPDLEAVVGADLELGTVAPYRGAPPRAESEARCLALWS